MLEILEQYSHVVIYNCSYVMLEILEQYSHVVIYNCNYVRDPRTIFTCCNI